MAPHLIPEDPAASPPFRAWARWYFSRGWFGVITIPLFLFLAIATYSAAKGGIILWLAFGHATHAVYGSVASLMAFTTLWPLALLPAFLCYSLLKNTSGLWLRRDVSMRAVTKLLITVAMLIALLGVAQLIAMGEIWAVAWVADRDPCAAAAAGVTGSHPPTNCVDPNQEVMDKIERMMNDPEFKKMMNDPKLTD